MTGEVWYSADDVITLLDYFKIDHARPSWPTNRWMTALLRLFRPLIVELVRMRDKTVEDWAKSHPQIDDILDTAKADFKINRHDWGISYAGKPDDLIKDEVAINLDLKFPRAEG